MLRAGGRDTDALYQNLRDRWSTCRLDEPHRALLTVSASIDLRLLFLVRRFVLVGDLLLGALLIGNIQ